MYNLSLPLTRPKDLRSAGVYLTCKMSVYKWIYMRITYSVYNVLIPTNSIWFWFRKAGLDNFMTMISWTFCYWLLQNPCGHQISRVCMNLLTSLSTSSVPCIICDSPCLVAHATTRKTSFLSIPPQSRMEQESKLSIIRAPSPIAWHMTLDIL